MKTMLQKVLDKMNKTGKPQICFDKDYATSKEELTALWNYTYEKMKDICMNIPSYDGVKFCQENNIYLGSYSAQIITYIKLLESNFEALSIESAKLIEEYEELENKKNRVYVIDEPTKSWSLFIDLYNQVGGDITKLEEAYVQSLIQTKFNKNIESFKPTEEDSEKLLNKYLKEKRKN